MMRKQLSKKKLERLTIVGGDFRAAGKRLNKRGLTADELRKLLEDDVDFSRVDGSSSQSKGSAKKKKTLTDIEDIEKVISDEELRLIMDRKLLFQNSTWNKNLLKLQAVQTPNSKDSIAKRGSRTSLTTCDSNSSVPADSEDDDIIDEKDVLLSPDGDNQCAALVEQVQDMDDLFSIPTEGAMYDVIDTGRATFMAIN